jgi:hypothetical protein
VHSLADSPDLTSSDFVTHNLKRTAHELPDQQARTDSARRDGLAVCVHEQAFPEVPAADYVLELLEKERCRTKLLFMQLDRLNAKRRSHCTSDKSTPEAAHITLPARM